MTGFGPQGYKGSKGDPVSLTLIVFLSYPFPSIGDIHIGNSLGQPVQTSILVQSQQQRAASFQERGTTH